MKNLQDHRFPPIVMWMLAATGLVVVMAGLLLRFSSVAIWDDAWFFARYGHNLLEHGEFQWNPGSRAFGLTAPLYGLLVFAGQSLGLPAGIVLWTLSFLAGVAVIGLLLWHIHRHADTGGTNRKILRESALLTLAMNAPAFAAHLSSGMETTSAMLYGLGYLMLLNAFAPKLSPGKAMVIGFMGGWAWLLRPELLLFTIGVPLGLLVFGKKSLQRREAAYALLFTGATSLGAAWIGMRQFASLLPLSFHAKTLNAQDPGLIAEYRFVGWEYLGGFLLMNLVPLAFLLAGCWIGRKSWWRFLMLHERLLLVALLAFILFQAFAVMPVMGYFARFLYPAWPVLMWLGTRSAVFLLRTKPDLKARILQLGSKAGLVALLCVGIGVLGCWATVSTRLPGIKAGFGRFGVEDAYKGVGQGNWPLLGSLKSMPDSIRIASTELGILGMMRPNAPVIDLSGLQDPISAHDGFSADRLFRVQKPHLIYLPLATYSLTRKAILAHPDATTRYTSVAPPDAFTEILVLKGSTVGRMVADLMEGEAGIIRE